MIRFKHHIQKSIGTALSAVLAREMCKMGISDKTADCILCIPNETQNTYRFHPAAFVAKQLSKHIHVPFYPNILVQTKNAKRVGTCTVHNIRGKFKITSSQKICGKNVILISDLFVGGRSAIENARILKKSGAKAVWVFTLASGK